MPIGRALHLWGVRTSTRRVVNAALELAPRKPDEADPLPLRAKAALIEIGRESLLNRLRVKRYGITDAELDADAN
jgi:hypothetical protein